MSVEGNQELAVCMQRHISAGNQELERVSRSAGYSWYGAFADALEQKNDEIERIAEGISGYFAQYAAAEVTARYEKDRNFFEKWIHNDPMELKKMETERAFITTATDAGVQFVVKGGIYATKFLFRSMDQRKAKREIWNLCLWFARDITDNAPANYRPVAALLSSIYRQLFGAAPKERDFSTDAHSKNALIYRPSDIVQEENAARLLYMLYMEKYAWSLYNEERQTDIDKLFQWWAALGIIRPRGKELFRQFELLRDGNAFECFRLPAVTQGLFQNLYISLPNINFNKARQINREMLLYVPNGDKQRAVRRGATFVGKAAIAATASILGSSTGNPALLNVAATSALSLYQDLSNTEVIGNCLAESGVSELLIRESIAKADSVRKQTPSILQL